MVEQPPFVTGVFGMGVNVGAGEGDGVGIGDDSTQEVRRRKDNSKKIKTKSFFICTSSPFSRCHCEPRQGVAISFFKEQIAALKEHSASSLRYSQHHNTYCPTAFFNSSNEVIHAILLIKSASNLLRARRARTAASPGLRLKR